MSRRIHCRGCGKHVGTIEAGSKLAKGLQYECSGCAKKNVFQQELNNIRVQKDYLAGLKSKFYDMGDV